MADTADSDAEWLAELDLLMAREDPHERRLAEARETQPLAYELVLAAHLWDELLEGASWASEDLTAQTRRRAAAGRASTQQLDDQAAVQAALGWALQDPALLVRVGTRYQLARIHSMPVTSSSWRADHRQAAKAGALVPLELVIVADRARERGPDSYAEAEDLYRKALDSDDQDAVAFAALNRAELIERRDGSEDAVTAFAAAARLSHPVASPAAEVRLAEHDLSNGARDAAHERLHRVIGNPAAARRHTEIARSMLAEMAWQDGDHETAIAHLREAIEVAGGREWGGLRRRLMEMLAAQQDLSGAADTALGLLDNPLFAGEAAHAYVGYMASTGEVETAVAVLKEKATEAVAAAPDLLLAIAAARIAQDDLPAVAAVVDRLKADWSYALPRMRAQVTLLEAGLAINAGDDAGAAALYRTLIDGKGELRDAAAPLLLKAVEGILSPPERLCLIAGARPLLEFAAEHAPEETAASAAASLAHQAAVDQRDEDRDAALRIVERHQGPSGAAVVAAHILLRTNRLPDALAQLREASAESVAEGLIGLLEALLRHSVPSDWADLRELVDQTLAAADEAQRGRLARAAAQFEREVTGDGERIRALSGIVVDDPDPAVAAEGWLAIGESWAHQDPARAVPALQRAVDLGSDPIAKEAVTQLACLAEMLPDVDLRIQLCTQAIDQTYASDDTDWALVALCFADVVAGTRPDDAEEAYWAVIDAQAVDPANVGLALARLSELYARLGNQGLAEDLWRQGEQHPDPSTRFEFQATRAEASEMPEDHPPADRNR